MAINKKKFVKDLLLMYDYGINSDERFFPFNVDYVLDGLRQMPELFNASDKHTFSDGYWRNALGLTQEEIVEFEKLGYHTCSGYFFDWALRRSASCVAKYIAADYPERLYDFCEISESAFVSACKFARVLKCVPNLKDFVMRFVDFYSINAALKTEMPAVIESIPADYVVEHYKEIESGNIRLLSYISSLPSGFIAKRPSRFSWSVLSRHHVITDDFLCRFRERIDFESVGVGNVSVINQIVYDAMRYGKDVDDAIRDAKALLFYRQHIDDDAIWDASILASKGCYSKIFSEMFLREKFDESEPNGSFEKFCEDYVDCFFDMETHFIKGFLLLYPFSAKFINDNMSSFVSKKCGKAARERLVRNITRN